MTINSHLFSIIVLEGLNDLTTVMGPGYVDDLKRQLGNEMENDTEFIQQIAGRSTRGSGDNSDLIKKVIDMLMDRVIQPTMARIDKDKVDKYNKAYDDIIELRDQTSVIDNGSATHIQLNRIKAKKAFDESIEVVTDIITKTKVNRSRIKDINCPDQHRLLLR